MKALLTAVFVALLMAAAAAPATAGDPQDKHVQKKVVKIERHLDGAWLGVALQDVAEHELEEKQGSVKAGAVVTEVVDKSPADSAGIKEDDVITELNGKPVATAEDVVKRIGEMKTGETVTVAVMRDGAQKSFSVKLGARPAREHNFGMGMPGMPHMNMQDMPTPPMFNLEHRLGVEGMKLMELNDQLGKYFDAPDGKALLVTNVKKNSNAHKAGIVAGDVVYKIGTTDIEDMSDLHQALKDAKEGSAVDVQLIRKGAHKTVKLEISKHEDMMMNMRGSFPWNGNFNFDFSGFNPEHLHEMIQHMKPELDRIRKEVRVYMHDGSMRTSDDQDEELEEAGTEL
jgi:membrane-associated protease RseP (regulator of RpoE activity)